MRDEPPAELVDLVVRLRLASAAEVRAVCGRAKSLAHGLPLFPSVWVDALAQARRLSPFQAAEINAGRGNELSVGPFVLIAPLRSLGFAESYRAREIESGRVAQLLVASAADDRRSDQLRRLMTLVSQLHDVTDRGLAPFDAAGEDGRRLWIASTADDARTVGDWLRSGRLPGEAVLEIARQMAASLAALEQAHIVHGDLSASSVVVADDGTVRLQHPGVRGILRPRESLATAELPPEAFDNLAPERIATGAAPTIASDLYACGCLWWQMLTGRPALAGGDSVGKLRAAQMAKIPDVRRLAPDVPGVLATAIGLCTQTDPQKRGESFLKLAGSIGPPTRDGRRQLIRALSARRPLPRNLAGSVSRAVRSRGPARLLTATAVGLVIAAALAWPIWRNRNAADNAGSNSDATTVATASLAAVGGRESRASAEHRTTIKSQKVERAAYFAEISSDNRDAVVMNRMAVSAAEKAAAVLPLVLPAGKPMAWNPAELLANGQTVRGEAGTRPLILVPAAGIVVAAENVRFENIDFVWSQPPEAFADPEETALIDLRAARAMFHGCTFQAAPAARGGLPPAIRWRGPRRGGALAASGQLRIENCVFSGVAAGIDCRLEAPLGVQIGNSLHLGPGPLLRINRCPRPDETIALAVDHSTLRDAAGLAEFRLDRLGEEPAAISVTTTNCVFVPRPGNSLLLFASAANPLPLVRAVEWTGQGSLLSTTARAAAWSHGTTRGTKDQEPTSLDDIELSIEGLVASPIEFAGPAAGGAAASRAVRWQAPLESADPPGIGDDLPPLPRMDR